MSYQKQSCTQEDAQRLVESAFMDGLAAGFHIGKGTFGTEDFMGLETPEVDAIVEEFDGWVDLWMYCGGGPALLEVGLAEEIGAEPETPEMVN